MEKKGAWQVSPAKAGVITLSPRDFITRKKTSVSSNNFGTTNQYLSCVNGNFIKDC